MFEGKGSIDINDPAIYKPSSNGIHLDIIFQQAICSGWLTKHRAPNFAFMKSTKRRYVVLVDRMLYSFKSERPTTYREFFEITKDTHAYVTEGYCIEIKKKGYDDLNSIWQLQADNVESMKLWLSRIKRVIDLLKNNDNSRAILKYEMIDTTRKNSTRSFSSTSSNHSLSRTNSLLSLPPQLPPPKSLPPPIPSSYACS